MAHADSEIDALLSAAGPDPDDAQRFVDVGRLRAFRDGRLEAAEAAEVEALLVESPKARDLLAELATPVPQHVTGWAENQLAPAQTRRVWPYAGGLVALAAASVLFLLWPGASIPVEYRLADVAGGVQAKRADVVRSRTYGRDGRVRLTLVPASEAGAPEMAPHVRVFLSAAGGRLTRADMEVTERDAALRLEAGAHRLFGLPGPKLMLIGLAHDAARLEQAAGRTIDEARALDGVRWVEVGMSYTGQ